MKVASSFETRRSGAPQDEGKMLLLMVRSVAKQRVSNHAARNLARRMR
jgi:hypothetical protein